MHPKPSTTRLLRSVGLICDCLSTSFKNLSEAADIAAAELEALRSSPSPEPLEEKNQHQKENP